MEIKLRSGVKPIVSQKQLEELLNKTAKGVVTGLAQYATKALKYTTERNLYQQDLVGTSHHYYERSGYLYGSITSTRTENTGDSFYSVAGFEDEYLRAHATKPQFKATKKRKKNGNGKKLVAFGRYTDIFGNYVGDEMIEDGWIEDGTSIPSIVPRRGTNMLQDARDMVEEFIDSKGIEGLITNELGQVVIERTK